MTFKDTLALFEGEKTVAICGHVNPDGDALGSALALAALLRAKGCAVTCLLAQDRLAPMLYRFLDNYEFTPALHYTATPDLFIAVDAPSASRIGDSVAVMERSHDTLVIDHHPDYLHYANHYLGDTASPATGLLVWQLIEASGITPTRAMAAYCYVALMTDTGRFAFQNTTVEAFRAAARMLDCGVDPAQMSANVYENKSFASMQLESRLIDRMRFCRDGRVVYSWVDEQDFKDLGVTRDDTESLPNVLRSIIGVEVAALLREEDNSVRVNLRAKNGCDVGAIARNFGGGGHAAAAGLTLDVTLEHALAKLVPALEGMDCLGS